MIREFQDEYRWLSNFWPSPFTARGKEWPTVEHFYQAMKSDDPEYQEAVRQCRTPGDAKRMGRRAVLRWGWEESKSGFMREALEKKFSPGSVLATKLLGTGGELLQEGNRWGDTYWGVDLRTGLGKNTLGNLLMEIRERLIKRA